MPYKTHVYERYEPGEMPKDPGQDLDGWTFESAEHGGKNMEDLEFPHVIIATDMAGRTHKYQATTVGGEPVNSIRYEFETAKGSRPLSKFKTG